jgi:hypothetical protein
MQKRDLALVAILNTSSWASAESAAIRLVESISWWGWKSYAVKKEKHRAIRKQ